jgi:VWFA-related protein
MTRFLRTALTVFLAALLIHADQSKGALSMAPQQDFRLKITVDLVTVDVTVHGSPARELTADDFVVYDNNVPQRITHFSRDRLPLAVALVLDESGSLSAYMRQLQAAARTALGSLKPEDKVVLFGFSLFPTRLSDLTQDTDQIVDKLARIKPSGTTNIWDAIYAAAHYLRVKAPDHRRAIILISDDGQLIDWGQTGAAALQEALVADTGVYAIRIAGSAVLYAESDTVRMIARNSGGEYLDAPTGAALAEALHQCVSRLREQYTLGFNPSRPQNNGSFHVLRVALQENAACRDCRIHTRTGYYDGTPPIDRDDYKRIPPSLHRVPASVYTRMSLAAAEMAEANEISFRTEIATPVTALDRVVTRVGVWIDASDVQFKTTDGIHAASLCIALFSASAEGICFGTDWRMLDLRLRDEMYQDVLKSGISYETSLIGSPRTVTAIVYDLNSGKMGIRRIAGK